MLLRPRNPGPTFDMKWGKVILVFYLLSSPIHMGPWVFPTVFRPRVLTKCLQAFCIWPECTNTFFTEPSIPLAFYVWRRSNILTLWATVFGISTEILSHRTRQLNASRRFRTCRKSYFLDGGDQKTSAITRGWECIVSTTSKASLGEEIMLRGHTYCWHGRRKLSCS